MLALVALLLAVPADDAAITVTGRRADPATVRAAANAHVAATLPTPRGGQYARLNTPVCARVNGLEPGLAARVADKLVAVAAAAGAKTGAAGCTPNVLITFTDNAGAVASRIFFRRPGATRGIDAADLARLRGPTLPVRWWNGIRLENPDGRAATAQSTMLVTLPGPGEGGQFNAPAGPDAVYTDGYSSSLIDTHVRASVLTTTVLVDVGLATGYRLDAVAAHVAMAVVGQARLPGGTPAPDPSLTIMGLFSAGATPPGDLTDYDRAFLRGLYAALPNRAGRRQKGAIVAAMVDSLAKATR